MIADFTCIEKLETTHLPHIFQFIPIEFNNLIRIITSDSILL